MASASLLSPSLRRRGLRTVRHGRKLPEGRLSLTERGTVLLLLLSAGCLLLAFLCGFTGHFQQHADFTIRNAIYGQLIAEPWLSSCRTGTISSTIWAIGCRLPARRPSALLHTPPGC